MHEWEDNIVNRVAKSVVGEKCVVRKSARWWDNDKINHRCEVYKKVVSGRKELWMSIVDYIRKPRKQ